MRDASLDVRFTSVGQMVLFSCADVEEEGYVYDMVMDELTQKDENEE